MSQIFILTVAFGSVRKLIPTAEPTTSSTGTLQPVYNHNEAKTVMSNRKLDDKNK